MARFFVHLLKYPIALVDHLQKAGYVKRVSDLNDKRAKLVQLTKKGEKILSLGLETGSKIERKWQALLGEEDFESFREMLDKLNS